MLIKELQKKRKATIKKNYIPIYNIKYAVYISKTRMPIFFPGNTI